MFAEHPFRVVSDRLIGRLIMDGPGQIIPSELAVPLDEALIRDVVRSVFARELGELTLETPTKQAEDNENEVVAHDWVIVRPGDPRYRFVFAAALKDELNARLGLAPSSLHQILVSQEEDHRPMHTAGDGSNPETC